MKALLARRIDRKLQKAQSIADLRQLAYARLPRAVFDFIDGGAASERTLRENASAFDDWLLMPRVAVDVSDRSTQTLLLGKQMRFPFLFSPTGLSGIFWPNGEVAAARAAERAGVPYCLSTNSVASLEDVARAVPDGDRWFQLYFLRDRGWMNTLLDRAARADYRVLCLTVDLPLTGRRERDARNAFTIPLRPRLATLANMASRPGWLVGALKSQPRFGNFESNGKSGFTSVAQHVATMMDPSANWDDIACVREQWRGPMMLKGLLHPEDAEKAVALGIEAVMVSNHGGRQLDQSPAAVTALPAIVAAIGGQAEVFIDGGISRGTDILKALALGARGVGLGRSMLWGLSAAGERGVDRALEILEQELDSSMALLGTPSTSDISRACVISRFVSS
ncbi:alpha-hydroxy-acid oxidizing protein [Alcaligenaceae bacterium]|nr:alpha-hydroxy-acid oxidizing protein [Alcaligenaceae bacterium]